MALKKPAQKRAKFHPKHLIHKDTAGGIRFYWQPSPRLKKAKWKPVALGQDYAEAVKQAQLLNQQVEEWRGGGAKPKVVKKFVARSTVLAIIEAYKVAEEFTGLAENTQRVYSTALNLIEAWAGDQIASHVTAERVKVFRKRLMQPRAVRPNEISKACPGHTPSKASATLCGLCGEPIKVGHHRAHNTLRVGRTLFAYGVKENMIAVNPFENFDLATPPPRDQIWDLVDVEAYQAAARRGDYPSLAFIVELAEYIGQREEDILKIRAMPYRPGQVFKPQVSQWHEILDLDAEQRAHLAGPDGRVMGIFVRQGKTKRWVGVPFEGRMRVAIETLIAANAKRDVPATTLLIDDQTGKPWTVRQFIRKFTEAKDRAVNPTAKDLADGVVPHPALKHLQFRDFRRTCVVRLGELGLEDHLISAITGHMLESVKKILEVYMPRTTKMAARAVIARIGQAARSAPEKQEDVA